MIDLKEAYEKAKANSEEDILVEAYENEDFYIFVFAETENPELEDNDRGGIAIDKKNGELKTLFGREIGFEINVKPSKEISLEEIKAMNLF